MPEQGSSTNLPPRQSYRDDQGWRVRTGLTLYEAEQLLDWLDQIGCDEREVQIDDTTTTVRWRVDPAHRSC